MVDTTKRLHAGVYIGVYYPNKYSTNLYDGYGFNPDGIKNDFANGSIRAIFLTNLFIGRMSF